MDRKQERNSEEAAVMGKLATNMKFNILEFMECADATDIDDKSCSKIIKYFTGDDFALEMKVAIADMYVFMLRNSAGDLASDNNPITVKSLNRIVKILKQNTV